MILRFDTQPKPKFKYSPAVRIGPFVQTAGMVGLNPTTGKLVNGGLNGEFRQILQNLDALIEENALPSTPSSATIYSIAFHRFDELNQIWDEWFAGTELLPVRTAVGVSQLPIGAQVEASFFFYAPQGELVK